MSHSQGEGDSVAGFNSPVPKKPFLGMKSSKSNKIGSPSACSPVSSAGRKSNVIEMFAIKSPSNPPRPLPRHRKSEKSGMVRYDSQDSSELSDDVFMKTKNSSEDSLSKSDPKSYSDRINERFKSVRDKAGKSTKQASAFKETAERILLERVRRETNDVDAEVESVRNRLQLPKTAQRNEHYDFFCAEKSQSTEGEEETLAKSTKNLSNNECCTFFVYPERVNFNLKLSEQEQLFKPKAIPVDICDKLAEEEPRHLEEEGFYVQSHSKIPSEHLNILDQRLSRDDKKWFNCEGKLDLVENPIQRTSIRPEIRSLPSNETTVYLPATTEGDDCEEIVVVRENILQLQISTLKFNHHPLFSAEHVLKEKLETLYRQYERSITGNTLIRLGQKLGAMREARRKLENCEERNEEKLKNCQHNIKKLRESLFVEGKEERETLKLILETWKSIKKLRQDNKYSNTPIRLAIMKQKTDYDAERERYNESLENAVDEIILEQREKLKRKKKAQSVNEEEIRDDLIDRFQESFRPPGEPILHFVLNYDNEVTVNVENPGEVTRRNVVASTKISLKIICNEIEVCKTKEVELNENFSCHFDETVSIQLTNIPKSITLEIIENPKGLVKRRTGEITLKLPSRNVCVDNSKSIKQTFETNETVHYKHEGVGSGIGLKAGAGESGQDDATKLNTSGFIEYTAAWDIVNSDEGFGEDMRCSNAINKIIDKNGSVNVEKLTEWLSQNKPDPQDPKNSILYEYSIGCDQDQLSLAMEPSNYFRLSPHLATFEFCSPDVLNENIRLTILQLRNRNEPEFDRMTVPNRIKEIPMSILDDYKRRIAIETEPLTMEDEDEEEEIEKRRCRGRHLLKQIYIKVFQKCKSTDNNLSYEDVIDEKFLLRFERSVKDVTCHFINWFRWRPVNSALNQSGSAQSHQQNLHGDQLTVAATVVIKIISAVNIPERADCDTENIPKVRPFVEVEYNNVAVRTSSGESANPTWNEELLLPLESLHTDYLNPNSLNGTLAVNVFDEQEVPLTKFGGIRGKNWLGYLEIPLATVCANEMVGLMKLRKPLLLLGYEKDLDKQMKSPKLPSVPSNQDTYLNLSLRVQPSIPKLTPSIDELPCSDVPYLKEHALKWNQNYNDNFPDRKFSVFAIDANATTTCIVRYLKPVEPPQINVEGFDVTEEQCARFVSLIPFTDCNQFYQNVWLSIDQFLHLMVGSVIDHAVALTCYLLALKLDVYLLLGFGIPHGSSAFVLIREYDSKGLGLYHVYDVVTGQKHNLTDVHCPVQKIYCVINENNIWANTQRGDNVNVVRLDLTRKSDWLPLFNGQISAPTNCVHGKITYLPIAEVSELEIVLEQKIRKKISKLRQLDRTIWNHRVSNAFKSVLSSFEDGAMYGKSNVETLMKLKGCRTTFTVKGPICSIPFTNVSSVVKRVKSIGLHLQENADVEFASAVYIRSYPNQVSALWFFVAAVTKNIN